MNYFIDIQIKPDTEMRENILLNKVYTKLHKALFELKSDNIGISFPEYDIKLGQIIRLHSLEESLTILMKKNWLGGLVGYCDISTLSHIPDVYEYRVISRKQSNMSNSKLQRLLKRKTISSDKVGEYKDKMFSQSMNNPYLEIESTSNGHLHRRYIQISKPLSNSVEGIFDYFGLSRQATIPWFK